MEVSGQPHTPAVLSTKKNARYPLNSGVCGLQGRPAPFGGEINLLSLAEFEPRLVQPVPWSIYWL